MRDNSQCALVVYSSLFSRCESTFSDIGKLILFRQFSSMEGFRAVTTPLVSLRELSCSSPYGTYTSAMAGSSLPTSCACRSWRLQLKILINLYCRVTSSAGLAAGPTEFIYITSRYSLRWGFLYESIAQ